MKRFIFITSLLMWSVSAEPIRPNHVNISEEERVAQLQGLEQWDEFAEIGWKALSRDEAIEKLSLGLRKTSVLRTTPYSVPEKSETHDRLKDAFFTIPGYAEYYRDRVLAARKVVEAVRTGADRSMAEGEAVDRFNSAQGDCFGTLGFLPSVETVRILGEFLTDDRGWRDIGPESTDMEREWATVEVPSSKRAASALERLPIVGSPFPPSRWGRDYTREELAVWKQWYQEIKDGKRTFRFEGDPTEYDLDGPAPSKKLERIALANRRDAEREAGRHDATIEEAIDPAVSQEHAGAGRSALLISAAVVLVALGWYGFSRRKSGRPS